MDTFGIGATTSQHAAEPAVEELIGPILRIKPR